MIQACCRRESLTVLTRSSMAIESTKQRQSTCSACHFSASVFSRGGGRGLGVGVTLGVSARLASGSFLRIRNSVRKICSERCTEAHRRLFWFVQERVPQVRNDLDNDPDKVLLILSKLPQNIQAMSNQSFRETLLRCHLT